MHRSIIVLALFSVALAAADKPSYPAISHDDLVKAIAEGGVTVIDVNGSESFQKAHVTGAFDYYAAKEAGDFADKLPEAKDALIVAYCGGPKCGAWKQGAKVAKDHGYTNVRHYSAGISGWQEAQQKQQKQN